MTWKSGDHLAGFAVPAAGPISLLGEAADVSGASATPVTQAEVVYRDATTSISPGEGRQLTVRTTTATGAATVDYLRAWFQGDSPSDGQFRSYDPGFGTLRIAFADGRSFWIDANGTSVTRAELTEVADGIVEGDHYRIFALSSSSDLRITRRRSPTGRIGDEESLPIQSAEVGDRHLVSTTTEDLDGLQVRTGAGGTGIVGPG